MSHSSVGRRLSGTPPYDALRRELDDPATRVLSLDVFDTVLWRDSATETERLQTAARRAATRLGADAAALTALRWLSHDNAYRAVAMDRPHGDARFDAICAATVGPLGLDDGAVETLRATELETDAEHLGAATALLAIVDSARAAGIRVIAVSDIYYSAADIELLCDRVLGLQPFDRIYTSSDLGLTKHHGGIFAEVARREDVAGSEIVHAGDSYRSDVERARAAGWRAVHLPRGAVSSAGRLAGRLRILPTRLHRTR